MYKARVCVTLREGIIDPQGKAVKESLLPLGYNEVKEVRIGKFIEIDVDVNNYDVAEKMVTEICEKLLVNKNIEDFKFKLDEVNL